MLEAGRLEGGAYMKLDMVGTANRRMSNVEPQNVEGNLIHNSRITLTQRTMHGRRVFAFSEFLTPCCQKNLLKGLK